MQPSIGSTEVSIAELEALLEQARHEPLREDGYQKLRNAVRTLGLVAELLEKQETTLAELRELLCPASTEKTAKVLERAGINGGEKNAKPERKQPAAGHGRNGAAAYGGARRIQVPHESLKSGDQCPAGCGGKVYPQQDPGLRVRIYGQAPIAATVYELARLRCNLCGDVFTAAAPPEAGEKKYDATAASMMAVLRYGNGFPWTRLEGLQHGLGIPLPAATQCEILAETAIPLGPAFQELVRQAAQWELVHNDDTSMRVLSLDRGDVSAERSGVFTSGIVWVVQQRRIALFFTGAKHAGENLADVLRQRQLELPPPIQMCDALSRNMPKLPPPLQTVVANCLAHGRRAFVKVIASFPEQCRFVLETLGEVYKHDEQARAARLSPEERLRFHRQNSKPVMDKLDAWLKAQFAERRVELNSGLGKAISYLLNHWARLTLFLEKAGAPLDNNICERSLKKAILHRKNSLFYKTRKGARMGDLYMSLIHTCELNGTNPFDYLTELQRHAEQVKRAPGEWMPWNYREQQAPAVSGIDSG
jgi:transposase